MPEKDSNERKNMQIPGGLKGSPATPPNPIHLCLALSYPAWHICVAAGTNKEPTQIGLTACTTICVMNRTVIQLHVGKNQK